MKKLLLIMLLGMFLISSVSAVATYENWRYWNGAASGDYMLQTADFYIYTTIYKWYSTGQIIEYFSYQQTAPFTLLNSSTVVNDSFGTTLTHEKHKGWRINITQPIIADNLTVIWEYARFQAVDTWYALNMTNDTCGDFSVEGVCEVAFVKPINWAERDNSRWGDAYVYDWGYTIRARVLNATNIVQDLQISKQQWFLADEIRIDVGDTYTVSTLYALDVANGWGCITKTGTQLYHSTCDLDIRGEFKIDHGNVFSIGDMGGFYANHNTILMSNPATSKLQIGEKCGDHACQTGTLLYGNGAYNSGKYLYWYGDINIYGGTFLRYGFGYSGFAFGSAEIDWIDSTISSYIHDTLFFNGLSGNITNTNIQASTIYFYVPGINVDGMYVNQATIFGGGLTWVLFNQRLVTLNKYDTSPYAVNKVATASGTKVALENSNVVNDRMWTEYGGSTYMRGFLDLHDLKLKVIDTDGNPIENVTVKINNSNNFSALSLISKKLSTPFYLGTTWDVDATVTSCVPSPCSNHLSVGDKILRFGELDEVTVVGTTATFERNITGSFSKADVSIIGSGYPLIIYENATTDSDGLILKDGNYYQLLTGMVYGGGADVESIYDIDIFDFEISKEGYKDISFTLNVTAELGDDWDKPLPLIITLESEPSWNYSQSLAWKILNLTDTTILKLSDDGNLAIAGLLYENTNTPPPNVIYKIANVLWLTQKGDLYLVKELMEMIT